MQCIVRDNEDFVFAVHEDQQNIDGRYRGMGNVVQDVPHDFIYARDEYDRPKDPSRFAGEGGQVVPPGNVKPCP